MRNKGLNKEFFNYLANGLLLQPIQQYKSDIAHTEEGQTLQPVAKQRAFYDFQLAYWYEIKSLVKDNPDEGQEWFDEHLRAGYDEQNENICTGLFFRTQEGTEWKYSPLKIRPKNLEHFRKYSISELEIIMLQEYTDFSISKKDFVEREWNLSTYKEPKNYPVYIQLLLDNGLIEKAGLKGNEVFKLKKLFSHDWKEKAEKVLKESDIRPEWRQWKNWFVTHEGKSYSSEQSFINTVNAQ